LPQSPSSRRKIVAIPHVKGLHHHYERRAAYLLNLVSVVACRVYDPISVNKIGVTPVSPSQPSSSPGTVDQLTIPMMAAVSPSNTGAPESQEA
jgi:hypothetical protein